MTVRMNSEARALLREAGVTQAAWARHNFGTTTWHGDACGCPDDRCIGFHHDGDDCLCLRVTLSQYLRDRAALVGP